MKYTKGFGRSGTYSNFFLAEISRELLQHDETLQNYLLSLDLNFFHF